MSRPLRAVLLLAAAVVVVVVLFTVVFPWADRTLFDDPTLGTAASVG